MVYQEKELGCMTSTMRYFLMFINILFILASIAGVVVGVMMLTNKGTSYLKFCTACSGFSTFGVIVFGALLVFSALGFCALKTRNSCMLVLYAFFLIVFFLAATCITVVIIFVHEGKFDKQLSSAWNADAQKDVGSNLCEFQTEVQCNGWDMLCPYNVNNTMWDGNITARCPKCDAEKSAQINNYTSTCHVVLKNDIDKYYFILLGVGFGLMALTLISVIMSCKVRVQYTEYDELSERF